MLTLCVVLVNACLQRSRLRVRDMQEREGRVRVQPVWPPLPLQRERLLLSGGERQPRQWPAKGQWACRVSVPVCSTLIPSLGRFVCFVPTQCPICKTELDRKKQTLRIFGA